MIDGQIVPPGAYLSAIEILQRQYVAHLIDLAARGRLPGLLPMPRRASVLFGDSGWLTNLAEAGMRDGSRIVENFLQLFGDEVSTTAAGQLREFALDGLGLTVKRLTETWEERNEDLRSRLPLIDAAMAALVRTDPEQESQYRALKAERGGVARHLGKIGRAPAHGTLVEFGLLPNYSLIDNRTELEATLTTAERTADANKRRYTSEVREYARPARQALIEIRPRQLVLRAGLQAPDLRTADLVAGLIRGKRGGPAPLRLHPHRGRRSRHQPVPALP